MTLRISELSSALNKKFGDFPDYEESHRFYSNLSRTTKNKYLDFPLAACAEFKIVTIDELNAFVSNGHTDIKINHLQKSFEFAQGVLRIKIKEPHSLLLLASACFAVSLLYRIINEPLQEDMLKIFIAVEHCLTAKSCEAIGHWTARLKEKKRSQRAGRASKIKQPILQAIIQFLKEKPDRQQQSARVICNAFLKAYKESNSHKEIKINNKDYDVYYDRGKIYYKAYLINKTIEDSITLNTFRNTYISKAKEKIKS